MLGRVVEISQPGRMLRLERGSMIVSDIRSKDELGRIALDQLGAVLATARGITTGSELILALADRNIPLLYCDRKFVPAAISWPVESHHTQSARIEAQATATRPLVKRLWQQIVAAKIRNQALSLDYIGEEHGASALAAMSRRVRSGDPENLEAQAARRYWPLLFGESFRRNRQDDGINAVLNYAYAILRSATARAIMASGLHPSIGLHHSNRYNAMRLVDDLMEPYRPLFDVAAWRLFQAGHNNVTSSVKSFLAGMFVSDIETDQGTTPLMTALVRTAQSLARAFDGVPRAQLDLPPVIDRKIPLLSLPEPPEAATGSD